MMAVTTREKSRGDGLGNQRWRRYADAFDRVERCASQGHHLEAIAILDSLIGDRLASRLGHLQGIASVEVAAIGPLCKQLVGKSGDSGIEPDAEFRAVVVEIKDWVRPRNDAMHGIARVFRPADATTAFDAAIESHRQTVAHGMVLLQRFDRLDTAARRLAGKIPGTWPAAFFPDERPARPRPDESEVN
ncbi:hypothetical protein D5S18_06605 [Nocardia panacis]|uniref:Uncharacterized protein n=2 Tax=Nocardia panacis TaxID=2340916 RepID=A0A3A4KLU5_9NOCA|nr:hypothetical protein D5S18_06605 [Nocardia panacis]